MKIVLLRHGRPAVEHTARIHTRDIAHWVDRYNNADLDEESMPSPDTVAIARDCRHVVCSHLRRSLHSAELLQVDSVHLSHERFREAELPFIQRPGIHLSPETWVALLRILWLLGYARNGESLRQSKQRAALCAQDLVTLAQQHQSVLFVGHGFINRFIAQHLLRQGWQGPRSLRQDYWQHADYRLPEQA